MKGILWYVTRKLEGIFDGILMEFYIKSLEDKNQILKSMYIPRFLSSGLYGTLCAGVVSFRSSARRAIASGQVVTPRCSAPGSL